MSASRELWAQAEGLAVGCVVALGEAEARGLREGDSDADGESSAEGLALGEGAAPTGTSPRMFVMTRPTAIPAAIAASAAVAATAVRLGSLRIQVQALVKRSTL